MSLKLFRQTGFHSILVPGETRVALHPGWAVAAVVGWVALAANGWLWRALAGDAVALPAALAAGLAHGGSAGVVLGLLGWRRTLRLAGVVVLLLAALVAGGVWTQSLPAAAAQQGRLLSLLPAWASLLRWQVPLVLLLGGALPALWLWTVQLRRLSTGQQAATALGGAALSLALAATGYALLQRLGA